MELLEKISPTNLELDLGVLVRWKAIHQFVPMLADGDAIGGHVLWIRDHLRSRGCDSEIFVGEENFSHISRVFEPSEANHRIRSYRRNIVDLSRCQASTCADFLASRRNHWH